MTSPDDPPDTVVHVRAPHNPNDDVRSIKGSTRLEAKKQRRREGRESGRRRPPIITESEFLARRESVERTMVVRQRGDRTQIAVLEDDVLVEHYVNRTSHQSYVGNVYLGKVQNVLPSMEAAFVDIGKGRNAVLYAGEVNFDASGLEGQPKRIESALKAGQSVIVQVTKDPVGHKGARLTSQVSLPGRYLVYVPGASMTGISRKLPENERTRLKSILKKVTPEHAGVIVRTAAEGAAETELDLDITRLAAQWEAIEKKAKTASAPALLHGEPDLTVRVIRDVFNEDFAKLIVSGDEGWEIIDEYVRFVAPHLADRISRWDDDADDVFAAYRIDEQLMKALERKVWLPSGGSLVIDRTEAMTVIDVNTGKFTGQGGNLEETVTRNNLEAAEEIVRQLRLRDVGGIVVIDFIDMVLESNRDLVLRRLTECLARDRTKHQVAEVTSLGLVQMTRKRVGAGLLEAFSTQCECCSGRGVILTLEVPAETAHRSSAGAARRPIPTPPSHDNDGNGNGRGRGNGADPRPSNGRSGNRRSGGRPDNDWRAPAAAIASTSVDDTAKDDTALATTTALDDAALDSRTHSESVPVLDAAPVDTTSALDDAARNADAVEDNGGREQRPQRRQAHPPPDQRRHRLRRRRHRRGLPGPDRRRPESRPRSPTRPADAFASVAATPGDATATDDTEAPVRRTRTRAGSAVARVTIVSDPEPEAPAAEAPAAEPPATPDSPAEVPDVPAAEPRRPPDSPAEVRDVPAFEAADAFAPPAATEQPDGTEQPPAPEATTEPEPAIEPDQATDSELAIEPDVALETFAASVVPTFGQAEARHPAARRSRRRAHHLRRRRRRRGLPATASPKPKARPSLSAKPGGPRNAVHRNWYDLQTTTRRLANLTNAPGRFMRVRWHVRFIGEPATVPYPATMAGHVRRQRGTHTGRGSSRVYAIVRCGGRQEKVALDDVLTVDKLADEEPGSSITLPALLVVDDGTVISDAAELSGYTVTAEVVGTAKGPKINMIHYRNKTGYKRRQGHRQKYTQVRITGIEKPSKSAKSSKA